MNSALLKQQQESLVRVLKNKCIMVSGATGLVGSSIVRLLEDLNFTFQAGIKVIALCRNKEKYCKVFPKASNCLEFEYWDAATDLPIINDRVDYVIHCSGCSGGTKMHLSDPVKVFDINVNGTRRMLDWCAKTNAAFLYVSSYEIYGEISQEVAFDETLVDCRLK